MRSGKKNMIGVSLIEVILALVIATAIMMMGFKLYQTLNTDTAARRVVYNAEQIMQAAAYYYYRNCENMQNIPNSNTATLDPSNYPSNNPPNPYTLTIANLVSGGFLETAPAGNPLVNSSGPNRGYLVQFNMVSPPPVRYFCTTQGCDPIGYNVIWRVQVSVLINNVNKATNYLGMTGADCLTSMNGNNNSVEPCLTAANYANNCQAHANPHDPQYNANCANAGGVYNNYLSWERLPSMVSPKGQSPLWLSNPMVKQFKQFNEKPALGYMLANPTATYFKCGS